jgi:hypothetical protein
LMVQPTFRVGVSPSVDLPHLIPLWECLTDAPRSLLY